MTLRFGLPPLLAVAFLGASVLGLEVRQSAFVLAVFGGLYLALGTVLTFLLVLGRSFGRVPGFLAAWAVTTPLVFHVRELTYRPDSLFAVLAAALLPAALLAWWAEHCRRRDANRRRSAAGLLAAGLVFGLGTFAVVRSSELLRWHLYRHHKMLGTPTFYLFEDGVVETEAALFAAHRPTTPPHSPDRESEETEAPDLPSSDRPAPDPHLVFFMLDTLRADALALGGGDRRQMPRLNELLDGAWRFTDVVANASWTRPSVASFFTGLLQEEHGARDLEDPLEDEVVTLAEVLRDRGYETAAFVSNYGAVGSNVGFDQGFGLFYEFSEDHPYARAGRIRRTVERWLERRAGSGGSGPVFLYIHFLDPHEPYLAGRVPAHKSAAEHRAAYRAELAYLDRELAALVDEVRRSLAEDSGRRVGMFFASDHGEEFGEHEEYGHGVSLYPEVVRIPVAFHTVGDGDRGGDLPQALEGRDFFDLLRRWTAASGELDVERWARERQREVRRYSVYYSSEGRLWLRPYLRQVCLRAVERDGAKLIWSAYGSTRELYDRSRDPQEWHNSIELDPARAESLAADLDPPLREWRFPAPRERSAGERKQLKSLGYLD